MDSPTYQQRVPTNRRKCVRSSSVGGDAFCCSSKSTIIPESHNEVATIKERRSRQGGGELVTAGEQWKKGEAVRGKGVRDYRPLIFLWDTTRRKEDDQILILISSWASIRNANGVSGFPAVLFSSPKFPWHRYVRKRTRRDAEEPIKPE